MESTDKKLFLKSLLFPGILICILWLVKLYEYLSGNDLSEYGLLPQSFQGLRGILFSPLLHSSFAHLSANSAPLFVLSAGLFYFYGKSGHKIFVLLWLITGFWVWIFAKDTGIHIGASGVVYALAGYHLTSGILKREPRILAFALLVVFLYGSLIWGIFPDFLPEKNISWESHLLGLLAGLILAFFFRGIGPQRKEYEWADEPEPDEEDQEPSAEVPLSTDQTEKANNEDNNPIKVVYHFRQKNTGDQQQ